MNFEEFNKMLEDFDEKLIKYVENYVKVDPYFSSGDWSYKGFDWDDGRTEDYFAVYLIYPSSCSCCSDDESGLQLNKKDFFEKSIDELLEDAKVKLEAKLKAKAEREEAELKKKKDEKERLERARFEALKIKYEGEES